MNYSEPFKWAEAHKTLHVVSQDKAYGYICTLAQAGLQSWDVMLASVSRPKSLCNHSHYQEREVLE